MDEEKRIQSGYDMIYLAACALHDRIPETGRVRAMDLSAVYSMAKFHGIQVITWMALERWLEAEGPDGITPELRGKWQEASARAIRKNILFDAEREKLSAFLEAQQIWYMPLKGVVLQDYYPVYGMRQMVDNDILFDSRCRDAVRNYFTANGYEVEVDEDESHDVYSRRPVYNFEMHFALYRSSENRTEAEYYENIRDRLLPQEGKNWEYRFTNEDFYIYCTTHSYKHFMHAGIGIRSLMDTYVYRTVLGDTLDWAYIGKECEKLAMGAFEKKASALAGTLFGDAWDKVGTAADPLSEEERALAAYYILSGTHGTKNHAIIQQMRAYEAGEDTLSVGSKIRYFLRRIFPDQAYCEAYFPFAWKHKILLPVLPLYRGIRALLQRPGKLWAELKLVLKTKK